MMRRSLINDLAGLNMKIERYLLAKVALKFERICQPYRCRRTSNLRMSKAIWRAARKVARISYCFFKKVA